MTGCIRAQAHTQARTDKHTQSRLACSCICHARELRSCVRGVRFALDATPTAHAWPWRPGSRCATRSAFRTSPSLDHGSRELTDVCCTLCLRPAGASPSPATTEPIFGAIEYPGVGLKQGQFRPLRCAHTSGAYPRARGPGMPTMTGHVTGIVRASARPTSTRAATGGRGTFKTDVLTTRARPEPTDMHSARA